MVRTRGTPEKKGGVVLAHVPKTRIASVGGGRGNGKRGDGSRNGPGRDNRGEGLGF